jgi:6-phosphogluconolactonase
MNKKASASAISLTLFFLFLFLYSPAQKYYLFIGTYTNTGSKGIYVYDFNAGNGKVKPVSHTDSVTNPSYLTVSQDQKYVYAVNETNGASQGRVSAYSFDKKNGTLHFLNTAFTGGDDPCFISVTSDNKWLTAANYSSGSAAIFPLNENGTVRPYTQLIADSIYREAGQTTTPHVHETVFSPDEKYFFTPDLGLDKVMIYRFDPGSKQPMILHSPPEALSDKGSGPRHIVFHPNGRFVYLMHEMGGTVTTYRYEDGRLEQLEEMTTFPQGFTGKKDGAEVCVSPDGKFLYTSDRGEINSITIFKIDPQDGKLTWAGYQSTFGKAPRNFIIDPSGRFLLAANQDSDNIVIFRRNKNTGLLTRIKKEIRLPRPVCLQLIPRK